MARVSGGELSSDRLVVVSKLTIQQTLWIVSLNNLPIPGVGFEDRKGLQSATLADVLATWNERFFAPRQLRVYRLPEDSTNIYISPA